MNSCEHRLHAFNFQLGMYELAKQRAAAQWDSWHLRLSETVGSCTSQWDSWHLHVSVRQLAPTLLSETVDTDKYQWDSWPLHFSMRQLAPTLLSESVITYTSVIMKLNKFLKIWLLSVNYEKFTFINLWSNQSQLHVWRFVIGWLFRRFIEVNFSKLTDSNQIFRTDLFAFIITSVFSSHI